VKVLVRRQMGVGLPGNASSDDERLSAVESFAAAGGEEGARRCAACGQPFVEDVAVDLLDGEKLLYMPALAEHVPKAPLVILRDIDGKRFTDAESGARRVAMSAWSRSP
jgi:hypothetical protein